MNPNVKVIGTKGVIDAIRKLDNTTQEACKKAVEVTALSIRSDAISNLKANKSYVSGGLADSIRIIRGDKGFGAKVEAQMMYAQFVEYGRKAGGFPPPQQVEQWLKKKGGDLGDKVSIEAFFIGLSQGVSMTQIQEYLDSKGNGGQKFSIHALFICNKIAKQGTKPRPFFFPAVERNRNKFVETIKKLIK